MPSARAHKREKTWPIRDSLIIPVSDYPSDGPIKIHRHLSVENLRRQQALDLNLVQGFDPLSPVGTTKDSDRHVAHAGNVF
jgi:hypothetical protein